MEAQATTEAKAEPVEGEPTKKDLVVDFLAMLFWTSPIHASLTSVSQTLVSKFNDEQGEW